jgi:hypothetical protein
LLAESNGILRVEDLMPLLPDFTEIDMFKEEICHTLEDCGSRIDHLKLEMSELAESAESITTELEGMKRRGYYLSSKQRCEYCSESIFSKQFYIFPCSHGFHSSCILKRVHLHVDSEELAHIKGLSIYLYLFIYVYIYIFNYLINYLPNFLSKYLSIYLSNYLSIPY